MDYSGRKPVLALDSLQRPPRQGFLFVRRLTLYKLKRYNFRTLQINQFVENIF